jgi:hypothetical protein
MAWAFWGQSGKRKDQPEARVPYERVGGATPLDGEKVYEAENVQTAACVSSCARKNRTITADMGTKYLNYGVTELKISDF